MSRYEFYLPPVRQWPRRWLDGYRTLLGVVWPYIGWYVSRRECARLINGE